MIALDKVLCQHWNKTSDEGVDGIYREENWGWLINDNCPEEKKVVKNYNLQIRYWTFQAPIVHA